MWWIVSPQNGLLFSLKKEVIPDTSNSMDERGGHYAKWNKPVTERQILYDLTYMWNLNSQTHRNKKKNSDYQGLVEEGNWEILLKGYKVSVMQDWCSGELMYNNVIIVKNIVLCTWNL